MCAQVCTHVHGSGQSRAECTVRLSRYTVAPWEAVPRLWRSCDTASPHLLGGLMGLSIWIASLL